MDPFPDLLRSFRQFIPSVASVGEKKKTGSSSEEDSFGKSEPPKPQPMQFLEETKAYIKEDVIPPSITDDDISQFEFKNGEYCEMQTLLKSIFQNDEKTFEDVFKCIQLFAAGIVSIKEFEEVIGKVFEERGAEKEKEILLRLLGSRCTSRRQLSWCCRPSSDLVQARCKRTGSYLMLPDEYPAIISTGRDDKLGKELNDMWISVASGSEDFSFKVYRKNIYEDQLTKCEDERFEHDMAINYSDYAIECFERLLNEMPAHIANNDMYL